MHIFLEQLTYQWFSSIHYKKRHEAYILINDFEIEFYKLSRHPHSRDESKNDHKIKFSVRGTEYETILPAKLLQARRLFVIAISPTYATALPH